MLILPVNKLERRPVIRMQNVTQVTSKLLQEDGDHMNETFHKHENVLIVIKSQTKTLLKAKRQDLVSYEGICIFNMYSVLPLSLSWTKLIDHIASGYKHPDKGYSIQIMCIITSTNIFEKF